jgi:hypothetical protein
LGKRLGNQRNRIIGGYRIEKGGTGHKSVVLWKLVPFEKKRESEIFPREKEMTPPPPPSPPEQDGTWRFDGGVPEGLGEGSFDPLQTPSQPPPPEDGSGYGNGGLGGGGGVKTSLLGEKNSPDEIFVEVD